MITCKEDLLGKFVYTKDKEVLKLFVDACNSFGIRYDDCSLVEVSEIKNYACRVCFEDFAWRFRVTNSVSLYDMDLKLKPLTLSDFKPRTKVEYVELSLGDAAKAMVDGEELYGSDGHPAFHFDDGNFLCGEDEIHVTGKFYRHTETPYTWLDEVSEYVDSIAKAADEIKDEELITIEGTFTREQLVKLGEIASKESVN